MRHYGAPSSLQVVYEAGPCGYTLARQLLADGFGCQVIAASRLTRSPTERIKTDRRDALKLARSYRAGDLTAVWVPDAAHEALRDLVRARETVAGDAVWLLASDVDAAENDAATLEILPGNRVLRVGGTQQLLVRYVLDEPDMRRFRKGLAMVARMHFAAGALEVIPGIQGLPYKLGPDDVGQIEEGPLDPRCYIAILSHLFGGCRLRPLVRTMCFRC